MLDISSIITYIYLRIQASVRRQKLSTLLWALSKPKSQLNKKYAGLGRGNNQIHSLRPSTKYRATINLNNRSMRGGSLPSLHARGAAIDLMPDQNANHTPWPSAATMPMEVMEAFAREGWLSAGAFWGRDAMHFQATS